MSRSKWYRREKVTQGPVSPRLRWAQQQHLRRLWAADDSWNRRRGFEREVWTQHPSPDGDPLALLREAERRTEGQP